MTDGHHSAETLTDVAADRARDLWSEDWESRGTEPDFESLPPMDVVVRKASAMRELAEDHLEGPVTQRIRTWETGEFEIRVLHNYGPNEGSNAQLRTVLRYESHSGDVKGAVVELEGNAERVFHLEKIANIGSVET